MRFDVSIGLPKNHEKGFRLYCLASFYYQNKDILFGEIKRRL